MASFRSLVCSKSGWSCNSIGHFHQHLTHTDWRGRFVFVWLGGTHVSFPCFFLFWWGKKLKSLANCWRRKCWCHRHTTTDKGTPLKDLLKSFWQLATPSMSSKTSRYNRLAIIEPSNKIIKLPVAHVLWYVRPVGQPGPGLTRWLESSKLSLFCNATLASTTFVPCS